MIDANGNILFQARVLDNNDPMMLGRVRATLINPPSDMGDYESVIGKMSPPWDEEKDRWQSRDPFVFVPLLPYFIYQVPKELELVQIMYVNNNFKLQNQYYVQNNFSSPTATFNEYNIGANKNTGTGIQLKPPTPLKNQNGTYAIETVRGVFPEPGDNAMLGRGSADLIVKENEVLLRAGKFVGKYLQPNTLPAGNTKRGFLQLSRFQSVKIPQTPKKVTKLNELIVSVKYLIEWVITNPENSQDKFCGSVYLYQLKPDMSTNSKNLTVGTVVKESLKSLIAEENFNTLSKPETIAFINNFIKTCNNNTTTKSGIKLFASEDNKFPIFYRPNNLTYSVLNPSTVQPITTTGISPNPLCPENDTDSFKNLTEIFSKIKLQSAQKNGGYGLIYAKDKVGKPIDVKSTIVPQSSYINTPITYGALGADKLFLLSNVSSIPGKGKINFNGTLYGISGDVFVDEITPKTSSLVRGEELMELINLIVRFLITHTHAYPGLPPVPITQDGTSIPDILSELQNAATKILNSDIRLN